MNYHILLLADIHANEAALQTIIKDARKRYGYLRIWFLGDLFGRGPNPAKIWRRLIDIYKPSALVLGNHDWGLIAKQQNINVLGTWQGPFKQQDWDVILEHRQRLHNVGLLSLDRNKIPQGGNVLTRVGSWPIVCVPHPGIYMVHGGVDTPLKLHQGPSLKRVLSALLWGYVRNATTAQYTVDTLQWLYENWGQCSALQSMVYPLSPPEIVLVGHVHRRVLYFGPDDTGWVDSISLDTPYTLAQHQKHPILISPGSASYPRERNGHDKASSYAVLYFEEQTAYSVTFHQVGH